MSKPVKVGSFGRALDVLKAGGLARRECWEPENWLILMDWHMPILNLKAPYGRALVTMGQQSSHIAIGAHIDLHTAEGMHPGWHPTCEQMLADDWVGIPVERSEPGWKSKADEPMSNEDGYAQSGVPDSLTT